MEKDLYFFFLCRQGWQEAPVRLTGKTFAVMSATGRNKSKCFKYAYHFVFGCILHLVATATGTVGACACACASDARRITLGKTLEFRDTGEQHKDNDTRHGKS